MQDPGRTTQEPSLVATSRPPANALNGALKLGPYLDAWAEKLGALPTNPGLLGKFLKPVVKATGHELTLKRWQHFVTGLAAHPEFSRAEAAEFQRFAGRPALYDDQQWFLTDRDRANLQGLFG